MQFVLFIMGKTFLWTTCCMIGSNPYIYIGHTRLHVFHFHKSTHANTCIKRLNTNATRIVYMRVLNTIPQPVTHIHIWHGQDRFYLYSKHYQLLFVVMMGRQTKRSEWFIFKALWVNSWPCPCQPIIGHGIIFGRSWIDGKVRRRCGNHRTTIWDLFKLAIDCLRAHWSLIDSILSVYALIMGELCFACAKAIVIVHSYTNTLEHTRSSGLYFLRFSNVNVRRSSVVN